MTTHQDSELEKLVNKIMQSGFDVAMGGTPFKSEEENKADSEKEYDEAVNRNALAIQALIDKRVQEAKLQEAEWWEYNIIPAFRDRQVKHDVHKRLAELRPKLEDKYNG